MLDKLIAWWRSRGRCHCGRRKWYSPSQDAFYCEHGAHPRDERTAADGRRYARTESLKIKAPPPSPFIRKIVL